MSDLLICAAVVAGGTGWWVSVGGGYYKARHDKAAARAGMVVGLAGIAVALWLAYAAGAQT